MATAGGCETGTGHLPGGWPRPRSSAGGPRPAARREHSRRSTSELRWRRPRCSKTRSRATAFLLRRREAVWWAVRCVRSVPAAVADPKAVAALDAAAKWAASPTDDARRAAFTAAETGGHGHAGRGWSGRVFFTEGSLAPPKQRPCRRPRTCRPTTLANAVLLAAVITEPEKAAERSAAFVHRRRRRGGEGPLARRPADGTPGRDTESAPSAVCRALPSPKRGSTMGQPAARVSDMHVCPMVTGRRPARRRADPAAGLPDGADRRPAGRPRHRHGHLRRPAGHDHRRAARRC